MNQGVTSERESTILRFVMLRIAIVYDILKHIKKSVVILRCCWWYYEIHLWIVFDTFRNVTTRRYENWFLFEHISEYKLLSRTRDFYRLFMVPVKGNDNYMGQKVSFDFGFFFWGWNVKITVSSFSFLC